MAVCLLLCGAVITGQEREQKRADGPISVKLGDVYKRGDIKIEDANPGGLTPLPRGYSGIPKMAYRITTDAVAVGPYTVVFGVPSITDEETFNKLRVFHAEPDQFDPDASVWVDRTVTGANASAPDFSHRTITAYSDKLETGIYVIAKLTEMIAPSTAVADVEVVTPPAPGVVQMPGNITLSMIVKNNGPDGASNVGLKQQLGSGTVVSMKPSQGTCKWNRGWVYCKLGQLAVGSSATVMVEVEPPRDFWGAYRTHVEVAGNETDNNPENNRGVVSVDTRGDTNVPPEVTLESPAMEQVFEQGETVVFKATASDPDGSIMKVEFLDNDESIGTATTTDATHFSLSSNQLANGFHVVEAVATDNGGRQTLSNPQQIFVNGPIKVRILKPQSDSRLTAGSDLILTVIATHPSGSIQKIEVFYNGGLLGQATSVGGNRYTITLHGLVKTNYSIEAIATDNAGRTSKSARLSLAVTK